MGRARKSKTSKREKYASFGDMADEADEDADLPKDEAGRRKIKRQYGELLGIRIEKLRGRILNRERINKTIEGIYFICGVCLKVCHSLDDGLSEDPGNQNNLCGACAKAQAAANSAAAAAAKESGGSSRRPTRSRRKRAAAS
ncbi:hypothetical protein [Candidatus Binatus sp.]|jgi:hypothetical protein|uniref:hypothetical protein n=1 Tax=Candidatus Binatus sp. TaxID=2811406 RepID=UPI003BC1A782